MGSENVGLIIMKTDGGGGGELPSTGSQAVPGKFLGEVRFN